MSDCPIVITGAGIGGLVLALSLKKHCGVPAKDIEVYEQAPAFGDNVGGAMGLYANGLRVLRDVSPDLLATVREAGYDYIYRRWQRHDGSEVACAREAELTDDPDLQSIGIRRWKLQKALCDASAAAGIVIHFGKRADKVEPKADGTGSVLTFLDGTTRTAKIVFEPTACARRARGGRRQPAAEFTGVTCLMAPQKSRAPSAHLLPFEPHDEEPRLLLPDRRRGADLPALLPGAHYGGGVGHTLARGGPGALCGARRQAGEGWMG